MTPLTRLLMRFLLTVSIALASCANLSNDKKVTAKDNSTAILEFAVVKVDNLTTNAKLTGVEVTNLKSRFTGLEQRINRMTTNNYGLGWKEIIVIFCGMIAVYVVCHGITKRNRNKHGS